MDAYLLILVLSVVQSLFGVGLLLFGTPLMLALGHNYNEALLYLLPASASLSWSQVRDQRQVELDGGYRRLFCVVCLPLLLAGMIATNYLDLRRQIGIGVSAMLIASFALRTSPVLRVRLQYWMRKNLPYALGAMGLVHGLSNMGGSILTPLVSGLYKEKQKVLCAVSFDYAFMASFQLIVLGILRPQAMEWRYAVGIPISLLARYTIGKKVFAMTSDVHYQRLINAFILASAVVLISRLL